MTESGRTRLRTVPSYEALQNESTQPATNVLGLADLPSTAPTEVTFATIGADCGPDGIHCGGTDIGGPFVSDWLQLQYEWATGTGDGTRQPILFGHRLPTEGEMKKGPIFGAPVMMAPGETYSQAILHWASYLCKNGKSNPGFCEWSYTIGNSRADGWDLLFTIVGAVGLASGARAIPGAIGSNAARALPKVNATFSFPGAGRSGAKVKNFVGPPNSVVRGAGGGRVFVTDDQGRVILDITRERVKPVVPGQGFIRGDGRKVSPNSQQLAWIDELWSGS